MKNIIGIISALMLLACGPIEYKESQKVDFGDVGRRIELVCKDGRYIPKSDLIPEVVFRHYCTGTWKLDCILDIDSSGKLTDVVFSYSDGKIYPFFSLREEGFARQYIYTPERKSYADGSYSYDPSTSTLLFYDVVPQHPEFRLFRLTDTEMSGTFIAHHNDTDGSVLTMYVYKKLSYLDEAGLDLIYGAAL